MRPIMVEFTGTPEAGKTTVIKNLQKILEAQGVKVCIVQESAELTPPELPKGSWDANVWMRYITCAKILQASYSSNDIVIIDRGVIDLQFFGLKLFNGTNCSMSNFKSYMNMGMCSHNLNPDYLIALVTKPEISLARRGGPGRIVNLQFLKEYNNMFYSFYDTITLPKTLIETSNMSIDDVTGETLKVINALIKAR